MKSASFDKVDIWVRGTLKNARRHSSIRRFRICQAFLQFFNDVQALQGFPANLEPRLRPPVRAFFFVLSNLPQQILFGSFHFWLSFQRFLLSRFVCYFLLVVRSLKGFLQCNLLGACVIGYERKGFGGSLNEQQLAAEVVILISFFLFSVCMCVIAQFWGGYCGWYMMALCI